MKICKRKHEYSKNIKQCPICEKQRKTQYRLDNAEKIKQYYRDNLDKFKQYRLDNAEKIKQYYKDNSDNFKQYKLDNVLNVKKTNTQWRFDNSNKVKQNKAQWQKLERLSNSLYKFQCNLRSLIGKSIKKQGFSKTSKTATILSCSFEKVQIHLIESAIKRYGSYDPNFQYHIDHIIPCASAKNEKELIELQYYTNLQYLTPKDNLRKSDSWDGTIENESWNI
jgi:hypothetical protein